MSREETKQFSEDAAAPRSGAVEGSNVAPAPSFLPPDATDAGEGFLERLAPTLRPSNDGAGAEPARAGPAVTARTPAPIAPQREVTDASTDAGRTGASGLISAILTHDARGEDADEGARAALRTLPFRLRRVEPGAPAAWGPSGSAHDLLRARARAELLHDLAERQSGAARARLLSAAGELFARQARATTASPELAARARTALASAHAADPLELTGVRKQQSSALREHALERARALYAAERALPVSPAEQALAACAIAEIDVAQARDPSAVLGALQVATSADPGSLVPNLLRAQAELRAGRRRDAGRSLQRAAQARSDAQVRGLLFMEAGRAFEHAGDLDAAAEAYAAALGADPSSFGAALGHYRVYRATGAPAPAARALEMLERATPEARLRSEFARKRARLLREVMGNSRAALEALADAASLPGLREKLRAAEAAGDAPQVEATLQAWARAAVGVERGLALFELSMVQARRGARRDAAATLREAAIARAPQGLLAIARASIAQARDSEPPASGDPPTLDGESNAAEALRTAARLARDGRAVSEEHDALTQVMPGEPEHTLAEVLAFDAAAELSDLSSMQAGLLRELERLPMARRPGPALALMSIVPGEREELATRLGSELSATLRGDPLLSRFLAYRTSGATAAARWFEEAEAASGEQAAFAAVMAGHQLRAAGLDCVDAFAEALDHVRGHPAACFALELPARRQGDLVALERVDRELATTTDSRSERAGRRARLGLLSADSDVNHATAWFQLAAEDRPDDPLIADLLLRLHAETSGRDYPERLNQVAALESAPAFARAYRLRAAAALEASGLWQDAAASYRAMLEAAPSDAFLRASLCHALWQGQQWDVLATHMQELHAAAEPAGTYILEDWAEVEARRGDSEPLRRLLERILERRPKSQYALRGLARAAMTLRDDRQLLALSEASLRALEPEAEQSAVLRLCVRLRERLGVGGVDALLHSNERRLDKTLWYALAAEAQAISHTDLARYYEVAAHIASLLHDPLERAAYALRAAEALETAAPARALADLEAYLLAAPEHPLALPMLARLYRAASSPRAAADAFLRAAGAAREPDRAAELFHAAAVSFEDELRDEAEALAALRRVAAIDLGFADTFERLRGLLRARGEHAELLALLGQRAGAPLEPKLAADLAFERATLLRTSGDRIAAMESLRACLAQDPERLDALRALADLLWDEGEYLKAAESLVQLARRTEDKVALADVVFQLGCLYDEHLRDSRRAELAFSRVATLAPDDPRPIERLIQLWKRTGQRERAVRALQHLIANSWSVSTKEGYILELASTLDEMGERALAEQALEDARRQAPTSMRVLRAQAALYEREDDQTALSLHLQRSCNALRAAIDDEPSEPTHWLHLIELLEKRGRLDGSEMVIDAAYSCGVALDRPRPQIRGLGVDALTEPVLRRLVTRGLLDPLRRLLREFHGELEDLLPTQVEITGPLPESQTKAVRAVGELFAVPELRLTSCEPSVCVPVLADPLTLCMGQDLFLAATEAERFFLVSRAVVVAKHGLMMLVRAAPEQVLLVLHALRNVVLGGPAVLVANEREQRSVTRELAKRLPAPRRTQLRPLLSDLMSTEDFSTRRLAAAAYEFGSRVALTITGDLPAAIDGLLRVRGKAPEDVPPEERPRLVRGDPALRALLSFAISEAYLEARREVLLPAPREPR